MSADRELIRRDAERLTTSDADVLRLSDHCLALITELEQVELERDSAVTERIDAELVVVDMKARLVRLLEVGRSLRYAIFDGSPTANAWDEAVKADSEDEAEMW